LILEFTLQEEMVMKQGALVEEEAIYILILPLCLLTKIQKILQQVEVLPKELKEVPLLLVEVA
jgi:hypothetical protein